jgi:hypothetical protein
MKLTAPWRMFRRMQYSALAAAGLIYAGAVVHAWRVLPGDAELKAQRTLLFPAIAFVISLAAIMAIPLLRNALSKHLWISFRTGFGQSVISVLVGVGVLLTLAGFIYWNTWSAAHGMAPYPAGVFSGYAAGIGLLLAQTLMVRRIERDPIFRTQIEEP